MAQLFSWAIFFYSHKGYLLEKEVIMPAVSKKQRKFMGIVRGIQSGDLNPKDYSKAAQTAAKKMDPSDVKKYASTKDKGLPLRKESSMRLAEVVREIINSRK